MSNNYLVPHKSTSWSSSLYIVSITYDHSSQCIHGWIKLALRMLCNKYTFYDLLFINFTWHSPLTAADVRCVVANTRKMAKWMMCCMVSEGGYCSGEVQYTLNLSVGNIDINTEVLLPVQVCPDRSFWSATQSGTAFILSHHQCACQNCLAGTLIWCSFNVLALIKFH